ncbi:MAG: tol-pal system protein YbgF [Microscillaceae bacterium]|nr:tol-pal system protein YbgF [Microscillaceae bacterium]MDW8459813.1 tol-pal system protein YbgF [Cytophagales bacterium]
MVPFFIFISLWSFAQEEIIDKKEILLLNRAIEILATEGVNQMYNFDFVRAEQRFQYLKQLYPEHPLAYFLMGLGYWWRIMVNTDNQEYDDIFLAYMDSSLTFAHRLYNQNKNNPEASFFLSAAYGFKGRLYAERKQWTKAALAGNNALAYLKHGKQYSDLSPEFKFGDALYNYYSVWIPKNYPSLRPLMLFFKKGNKELGLQLLHEVANNSFYTRTEAQYFLMRIYHVEEEMPEKALPIAEYLSRTFPNNPFFQRYYAAMCFSQSQFAEAERVARHILEKIETGTRYYEEVSGRYACYILAYIYRYQKNDRANAKLYYTRAMNYAEQIKAYDSGYYHSSLMSLARIAKEEKDFETAKQFYEKAKKYVEKKGNYRKEIDDFLKEYKKNAKNAKKVRK